MFLDFDFGKINELVDKIKEENKDGVYAPFVEVYVFPQTWASSALGFHRMGFQAITTAYTVIITVDVRKAYVYFNGELAYVIENVNEKFFKDLKEWNLKPVGKHYIYKKNIKK